ncbi:outer membrane beta-barrel protein [Desertivirga brevis]|uniref:outer membrane beta-barrel protein n=1 Tax=Desertivirga brevis TaxID=2810310 RepID=UPI001A979619|nr:outer membrane beta-barrel protein [Pedobacter sp. SYSU D00873]
MHDQFDDRLSGRIRDVFENFEDGSADQGWKELRKRFPGEKERKVVPMWWWQSAAVLLMALGTWAYFGRNEDKIYLTGKTTKGQPRSETPVEAQNATFDRDTTAAIRLGNESVTGPLASISSPVSPSRSHASRGYSRLRSHKQNIKKNYEAEILQSRYSSNPVNATTNEDLAIVANEEQRVIIANSGDTADSAVVLAKNNTVNALERLVVADMLQKQKIKSAPAPVTQLANLSEDKTQPVTPVKKSKKVSIGVSAGSYMNYAKGSEGSLNTGVGLLSEISVSKKLKISTGISLAQNTLKFSTSIPEAASASFVASLPQEEELGIDKSGFGIITNPPVSYSLNKYNASLLGLDLPINLKYSLLKQKREVYISAGLSSNFFIEENYSYSYQVNAGSNSSTKHEDDNAGRSKFENFDLARMLNVSVGLEQPLTKQSRLSFEPFLKYPLGGQGARDIRFGSVGMNLKLNLNK